MLFREHRPLEPLSRYVDRIWYCQASLLPHAQERVLPSGTSELIIDLRHSGNMPDLFVGVHSQFITIDTPSLTDLIGIHFHPGGSTAFFGSAADFTQTETPLEGIWGATSLREQLLEAPSIAARFQILEAALLVRLRPRRRHPAVDFAVRAFTSDPNAMQIREITESAGLTPKRFIDLFRHEVGVTPKLYCRIRRFRQVLTSARKGDRIHWAEIASTCGYFDQSHFIRDFQAFSGMNPSEYLERRSAWAGHVALPEIR